MSTMLQLMLAPRQKVRERRVADDWLRSSTGAFVPEKYAGRAAELCSVEHRVVPRRPRADRRALAAPVTPAGMLRVLDLITQAGSPLYGTSRDARLGAEIVATLELLRPRTTERAAA